MHSKQLHHKIMPNSEYYELQYSRYRRDFNTSDDMTQNMSTKYKS